MALFALFIHYNEVLFCMHVIIVIIVKVQLSINYTYTPQIPSVSRILESISNRSCDQHCMISDSVIITSNSLVELNRIVWPDRAFSQTTSYYAIYETAYPVELARISIISNYFVLCYLWNCVSSRAGSDQHHFKLLRIMLFMKLRIQSSWLGSASFQKLHRGRERRRTLSNVVSRRRHARRNGPHYDYSASGQIIMDVGSPRRAASSHQCMSGRECGKATIRWWPIAVELAGPSTRFMWWPNALRLADHTARTKE